MLWLYPRNGVKYIGHWLDVEQLLGRKLARRHRVALRREAVIRDDVHHT